MTGKYVYSKNYEAKALRTRIEIYEGDRYAPVPGAFYGAVILFDEHDNVVQREALTPEDLDPIVAQLTGLKTRIVESSGAVFIEDAIVEPAEEDIELLTR